MVSIVIPCYNSQSTIARVLSSVINQTYTDYEVILVDDGSIDGTKGVVEAFFHDKTIDYKYIYQENNGPSAARNRGVENSSGEYIAFLDSDDVWHPQKLEIMISIINERKIDLLGHDSSFIDNTKNSYVKNDNNYPVREFRFYHLLLKNFAVTPSVVVSRKAYEKFNEKMRYTEDHELWLRISLKRSLYFVELPLVTLSRRPLSIGGTSENRWRMRQGEIKMYIANASYSKVTLLLLPLLILYSLAKFIRREFIIRCQSDSN